MEGIDIIDQGVETLIFVCYFMLRIGIEFEPKSLTQQAQLS